jgi:hypothetical protein
MQFLTKASSIAWMQERFPQNTEFEERTALPQLGLVGYEVETFKPEADSGRKVFFANQLWELFASETSVLVYLQNCEIFRSSGHLPLLFRLRQSLGETRSITEVPSQLFTRAHRDDAVSFFLLALLFFWDCLIVGHSGDLVAYISHDEYCDVVSRSAERLARARDLLRLAE